MYSYNDFEHFGVCYKLRGIPAGVSIEKFYMSNQVPYNLFAKWYKNTRKQIIPVLVLGALPPELEIQEIPFPILERNLAVDTWLSSHTELLILVDIRMSNGVHISQKNLSYESQFYLFTTCNSDNKSLVIQILDNYSVLPTCFQSKNDTNNGEYLYKQWRSHIAVLFEPCRFETARVEVEGFMQSVAKLNK